MFEIEVSESAQFDLEEAYLYYEFQREGLGDDMHLCFEEAVAILKRNPFFEIRLDDIRSYQIRRFPYLIFYRIIGNTIKIESFFFGKRDPSIWQERV